MSEAVKQPSQQPRSYLNKMLPPAVMIASALALMLLVNAAVSRVSLWHWFPVQFEDSMKLYAFATDPKKYDVVVIGSSVSERGIISQVMEEELDRLAPRPEPWLVYNTSMGGGFLPAFMEVTREIGRRPGKPRVALLMMTTLNCTSAADMDLNIKLYSTGSDLFTIFARSPRPTARWAALNSLAHGISCIFQAPLLLRERTKIRETQERHGSTYRYPFDELAERVNAKTLPAVSRSIEELKEQRLGELRDLYLPGFTIPPLVNLWVKHLADELKSQGVTLVILMAPESSWFVANAYHGEREQSVRFLREFADREGIVFFDLNDPPYSFEEVEYFDGCDHLGPRGAERLTRQITAQFIAPALAGKTGE